MLLPARDWLKAQEALRDMNPLSKVVMLHSDNSSTSDCVCASRKRGHFRLHNVRDRFTWSLPSSPFGSAALCLLRVWIKPSRERDCSLSPIRPPGGSGAHSQAACSQRTGKDLQKLLRRGNRPGDPRIRNHLQSSCPFSDNGRTVF